MTTTQQGVPTSPIISQASGQTDPAWYRFFITLWNRTGGTLGLLSTQLDTIGSAQGDILYRGSGAWSALDPGTSGQILKTNGPNANPSWTDVGAGTVTSVATGSGLTGGPITGSGTVSVAPHGIDGTLFRQSAALSVAGNPTNATADVADISGTADQVLVVNHAGTAVGFGPVNLAATAAVTGQLSVASGGTGAATLAQHGVVIGNGASAVNSTAAGVVNQVLVSGGASADPSWSGTLTGIKLDAAAGISAHAGGGQANATPLTATINEVTTVATAADSVKLPASTAGLRVYVANAATNAMQVFGNGTDTINGVASGTGVPVAGGKNAEFFCPIAGKWYMILSA